MCGRAIARAFEVSIARTATQLATKQAVDPIVAQASI
jgi:hypothetical protein